MSNTDVNAPAATPAPAPEDINETKRTAVAKHEFIDAAGESVTIDKAVGIKYTDRKSGNVFQYLIPGATPGQAITLLSLFGAKTKATNEASRVRNGQGGDVDAEFEALDEVFENITKGIWREKAEGGGGSRTDKALLAAVLVEALGEKAQGTVDTYQHRLETEEAYYKKVWSNEQIKAEYKKRKGQTGAKVDELV